MTQDEKSEEEAGGRGKPSVFVVDDDDQVLRSLRVVLSRSYKVHTCNDPVVAVEEIYKLKPDVIVLDLKMPVRDGFWVFTQVRKSDPNVPIIVSSAYQDLLPPEDAKGAFHPFAFLTKNGSLGEFLKVMKKAAEHAGW